jgi:hypothetical protein
MVMASQLQKPRISDLRKVLYKRNADGSLTRVYDGTNSLATPIATMVGLRLQAQTDEDEAILPSVPE